MYIVSRNRNSHPIHWLIRPSPPDKYGRLTSDNKIPAQTCIFPCLLTISRLSGNLPTSEAKPMIRPVSAIIEPIALPKALPGNPHRAARTETEASGRVVPNDTSVAPIIALEIPRRSEERREGKNAD